MGKIAERFARRATERRVAESGHLIGVSEGAALFLGAL